MDTLCLHSISLTRASAAGHVPSQNATRVGWSCPHARAAAGRRCAGGWRPFSGRIHIALSMALALAPCSKLQGVKLTAGSRPRASGEMLPPLPALLGVAGRGLARRFSG